MHLQRKLKQRRHVWFFHQEQEKKLDVLKVLRHRKVK